MWGGVKVNIRTSKQNLIITESGRPVITVDRRKTIEAVKIRRRAYYRDYKRLRKQHDPAFKPIEKLRPELSAALIGKIKSIGLKSLLGCSVAELRQHFESLFEPDMSWRNYGSLWHIDHIRPVATFQPVEPETTGQVLPPHQPAFAAGCPEHAGVAQRTDGRAS